MYNYFFGTIEYKGNTPCVKPIYFTDSVKIRQPYDYEFIACPFDIDQMREMSPTATVVGTLNPNGTGKIYKFTNNLRSPSPQQFIEYVVQHFVFAQVAQQYKDIL